MPVSPELATHSEVKDALEIDHDSDDNLITNLIIRVESALEDYTESPLTTQRYTERHDGGSPRIFVEHFPIKSGSVTITDTQGTTDDQTDDETVKDKKYRVRYEQGIIIRTTELAVKRDWDPGIKRFKIDYEAGLPEFDNWTRTLKPMLKQSIIDGVSYLYENRDPSTRMETLGGGYTTQKTIDRLPPRIVETWNRVAPIY